MELQGLTLTTTERRVVCVHEAAHAVVHALNPRDFVYFVEVAPIGAAADWTATGRKGAPLIDLWGLCAASDNPISEYLRWDEDEGYVADLAMYQQTLALLSARIPGGRRRRARAKWRRDLRAHVCSTMAGPIAEGLFTGEIQPGSIAAGQYRIEPDPYERAADATIAEVTCCFLPYRNEYEHLCAVTERLLMDPGVWQHVVALADALESAGRLDHEALRRFLPGRRADWPPSPRAVAAKPVVQGTV